jgi:hypothetical protein
LAVRFQLVLLLLAPVAAAQAQAVSAPMPGESNLELEEVEVIGRKLYQLQRELIDAQDRFYALYNELNTIDDFDIQCTMEAATGTLMRKRECRLEFLREAQAQEGQDFFLKHTGSSMGSAAVPPQQLWFQRQDEYRRNIRAILESEPKLQELAAEWHERQVQFDRTRKERLEGRRILIE